MSVGSGIIERMFETAWPDILVGEIEDCQRRVNHARRQEIDLRIWRNNMRKTLLVLKGGKPSTSPWF